ncbi:hypothetical protein D1872_174760 [compost metagenome]
MGPTCLLFLLSGGEVLEEAVTNQETVGDGSAQTEQPDAQQQPEQPDGKQQTEQPGEPEPEHPAGPQQVEVIHPVETKYPAGIEGIDYDTYTGNAITFTVRHEVTYGDILTSTLLAFLIIFLVIRYFHGLLIGGGRK